MILRIGVLAANHQDLVERLAGDGVVATGADRPDVLRDATILLADPTLAAQAMHDLPSLEWIQSTWAGVDVVLDAGLPPGVALTRLEGVFGTQMREFVFGHLLAHRLRITQRAARRTWDERAPGVLSGRHMGILGTGSIGRVLAETARTFDLTVTGCSRTGVPQPGFEVVYPVDRIDEFASGLEILVVVLPDTPATRGLVDGRVLALLRPGAVLVNVGRGSTVDVPAVVAALGSGRLDAAVLDVLPDEPLPDGHPWWDVPGLSITSHTAAWSRPGDVVGVFVENLRRREAGAPLIGTVDPDVGY